MFLLRLLLWALLFYLAYKTISLLMKGSKPKVEVKGTQKDKPHLDLSRQDVEDVDFKEVKD